MKDDKVTPISGEDNILVRDEENFQPMCLDEHIASVRLRTPNNFYNDGYDVLVSAYFGTERVPIKVGETELTTRISVQKAEIVVGAVRSHLVVQDVSDGANVEISESFVQELESSKSRSLSGKGKGTARFTRMDTSFEVNGDLSNERSRSEIRKREVKRTLKNWELRSDNLISVSVGGDSLSGNEVPETRFWKVIPKDTTKSSGVVARIRVREDWINFEGTEYISGDSFLGRAIEGLSISKKKRKRRLFDILIKYLSCLQLQEKGNDHQATLALAAIILKPYSDFAVALPAVGQRKIELNPAPIKKFLDSEDGQEEAVLVGLGVPRRMIAAATASEVVGKKTISSFLPRGSPLDALNALEQLKGKVAFDIADAKQEFGDNTLRDLIGLNLIKRTHDGKVQLVNELKDVDRALRRAVSNAPSMKTARSVLMTNPHATPNDIADAVSLQLDRSWENEATKKRRGTPLRRWSLWLENYLIDTEENPEAEVLVEYASSNKRIVGPPSKVTPERAREARRLLETGISKNKVAKTMNITPMTLRKILAAFPES